MSRSRRELKNELFEQFGRMGRAIAAPKRIELLDILAQGPRTVEALAAEAGVSVANASQHLKVLRAARLVEVERLGVFKRYTLAGDEVGAFLLHLRRLAASRLAEVEAAARAYRGGAAMEGIPAEELLRRVRAGDAIALDVRPVEEYRAGHLPGAISIPLGELRARLGELPVGREVVAYCRGPYCVMANEAVTILRSKGVQAHRMEEGVLEWRERGETLERAG